MQCDDAGVMQIDQVDVVDDSNDSNAKDTELLVWFEVNFSLQSTRNFSNVFPSPLRLEHQQKLISTPKALLLYVNVYVV